MSSSRGQGPSPSEPSENTDDFFVSNEKNAEGSWFDERSKYGPPVPHLVYDGELDLAVSDGFDLAVPHGVQAKNFFATKDKIKESNERLAGRNGGKGLSLSRTGRYLEFASEGGGSNVKLYEVQPKHRKHRNEEAKEGLDVKTPQRCNEMLGFVTGHKNLEHEAYPKYWEAIEEFLENMEPTRYKGWYESALKGGDKDEYNRVTFALSGRFQKHVERDPEGSEDVLARLRVNEFASTPRVGDGMVTMAQPDEDQDLLRQRGEGRATFHYGGVVAKSGKDFITMENYSREQHDDSLSTLSGKDPLWFFAMYGAGIGGTWHEAWTADRSRFLGATVTVRLRG
ncbi:hypothetical protein ACFUMJ_12630 [Streptomyces olivaceus]|uniref:hypothetical protein n=1 Tax=Streptomyces TaxID=1883 RepID=UPI001FB786E8|nr:hypothetical protein [Streptomyces sp. CB09030]UOG82818.1 hypothetical protein L6J92_28115 [Streptomyces sp. CB09030]